MNKELTNFLKYFTTLSREEQLAAHAEIVKAIKPQTYYLKAPATETDVAYVLKAHEELGLNYNSFELVENPGGRPYLRWPFTDKATRNKVSHYITFLKGKGKGGRK